MGDDRPFDAEAWRNLEKGHCSNVNGEFVEKSGNEGVAVCQERGLGNPAEPNEVAEKINKGHTVVFGK